MINVPIAKRHMGQDIARAGDRVGVARSISKLESPAVIREGSTLYVLGAATVFERAGVGTIGIELEVPALYLDITPVRHIESHRRKPLPVHTLQLPTTDDTTWFSRGASNYQEYPEESFHILNTNTFRYIRQRNQRGVS